MMPSTPIALLYLGGTFGCIGDPLEPLASDIFLPRLQNILHAQDISSVHFFAGKNIKDSSQLQPADWQILIEQIEHCRQQGFQHIVLIHGTDTLAYTAAFLHEFYADDSLNIIITGSQFPLLNMTGEHLQENSDALSNLLHAFSVVSTHTGIWVSFQNQQWPANQVQKIHTYALPAFSGNPIENTMESSQATRGTSSYPIQLEHLPHLNIAIYYCLPLAPAQQYLQLAQLLETPNLDALVILAFGSGNIGHNENIATLLKQASTRILIILSSQVLFGGVNSHYAAGSWLNDAGVLSAGPLTVAAIYARLMRIGCQAQDTATRKQLWQLANQIN